MHECACIAAGVLQRRIINFFFHRRLQLLCHKNVIELFCSVLIGEVYVTLFFSFLLPASLYHTSCRPALKVPIFSQTNTSLTTRASPSFDF